MKDVVRQFPGLRAVGKKALKEERKILARMERYKAEGSVREAKRLGRLYCHAYNPKYAAVLEANKRLPHGLRVRRDALHRITEEMDPRQTQGSARYRASPKPKGGFRPVVNFDLPARATQLLIKRAAKPFLQFRSDQYAVANGGRPAACRCIVKHIDAGYEVFIELDVRQFFASVNPAGVQELLRALPRKVVEANALSRSVKATPTKTRRSISSIDLGKLRNEVQSGIPQGSLLSPLLAEAVMAQVLNQATRGPNWPDVRLVSYLDNIAVLGRNHADVELAADILKGAFHGSRIGPFNLHRKLARSVKKGFDFIGIRFMTKGRRTSVEVTPAARSKALKWFMAALEDYDTPLWRTKRRVKSWAAAMSLSVDGHPLTRATQWANSVWSYALNFQLRGRALRTMASYEHRALHEPGFVYDHG